MGRFGAFPLRSVCVSFINMHKGRVHDVTHCYNLGKKVPSCILIISQQRDKRLTISYLVLKIGYINKTHTQSRAEKSYFNLAYVSLFSAKNRIYIIKHPTHTQNEAEIWTDYFKTVFSVLSRGNEQTIEVLSFSRAVSQFIMRVHNLFSARRKESRLNGV